MDRLLEIVIFWLGIVAGLYTLMYGLVLAEALETGDVYMASAEQLEWRLAMVTVISPCCFAIAIGFEIRNLYLDRKEEGRWRTKPATHSPAEPATCNRNAPKKSIADSVPANLPSLTSAS